MFPQSWMVMGNKSVGLVDLICIVDQSVDWQTKMHADAAHVIDLDSVINFLIKSEVVLDGDLMRFTITSMGIKGRKFSASLCSS